MENNLERAVCTHSSPKHYIVFSVYQSNIDDHTNKANHTIVKEVLTMPFKELVGSYGGVQERSFIVPNNDTTLPIVKDLCARYNQECYMKLDNHKHGTYKATFVDKHGIETFQGYLRSVSKDTIDTLKLDYSYREDLGQYFTIFNTDNTQM